MHTISKYIEIICSCISFKSQTKYFIFVKTYFSHEKQFLCKVSFQKVLNPKILHTYPAKNSIYNCQSCSCVFVQKNEGKNKTYLRIQNANDIVIVIFYLMLWTHFLMTSNKTNGFKDTKDSPPNILAVKNWLNWFENWYSD